MVDSVMTGFTECYERKLKVDEDTIVDVRAQPLAMMSSLTNQNRVRKRSNVTPYDSRLQLELNRLKSIFSLELKIASV